MINIKYSGQMLAQACYSYGPWKRKMINDDNSTVEPGSDEHLPSRQTFLLRFSDATQPEAGIYHGKVEHLGTGKIARFTSFPEVMEFTKEVMESDVSETGETS